MYEINEKSSFILYANYINQVSCLSDEEAGQLFKALLNFVRFGEYPQLTGAPKMAFSFISDQIERDAKKYSEIVEKRRAAGKIGGLKKAENSRKRS